MKPYFSSSTTGRHSVRVGIPFNVVVGVAEEELGPLQETGTLRRRSRAGPRSLKTSLLRMSWAAQVSVGYSRISGFSR